MPSSKLSQNEWSASPSMKFLNEVNLNSGSQSEILPSKESSRQDFTDRTVEMPMVVNEGEEDQETDQREQEESEEQLEVIAEDIHEL